MLITRMVGSRLRAVRRQARSVWLLADETITRIIDYLDPDTTAALAEAEALAIVNGMANVVRFPPSGKSLVRVQMPDKRFL